MDTPTDEDVAAFVALTRQKSENRPKPVSKLETHKKMIMAAVEQKLPVTMIREALAERCGLRVSYSNLRGWISRQT